MHASAYPSSIYFSGCYLNERHKPAVANIKHMPNSSLFKSEAVSMSQDQFPPRLPAPCIIDTGTVVNKQDMRRLLADLGRVRYIHTLDGEVLSQGEGCVLEVFADPQQSTLIANQTIYINVHSFDYLELHQSPKPEAYFDLIQDRRQLRLIPLFNPMQDSATQNINAAALEAMVTQVLSAKWDVQLDDDDCTF